MVSASKKIIIDKEDTSLYRLSNKNIKFNFSKWRKELKKICNWKGCFGI